MIPTILRDRLNENQLRIFNEFKEKILSKLTLEDFEEDCCMTSIFEFRITASGIGDSIIVHSCGESVWLDDGEDY